MKLHPDSYITAVLTTVEQLHSHLATIEPGLLVLIGAAGSGKSTVAAAFPPDQVSSLDHYRFLLSGRQWDQSVTGSAVAIQRLILTRRLADGRFTVIDSTNVEAHVRHDLVMLAAAHNRSAVAVHLDTPLAVCQARNRTRPDGPRVPDDTLRWQHEHAVNAVLGLRSEGFAAAFTLRTANALPRENS